jgi:hypothetical protein
MPLTEDDKTKVLDWISTKCGQMRCTCCGTGNWVFNDLPAILLGIDLHTTRFLYHQGFPAVSLLCMNCGHIVFFSSALMGFRPNSPELAETVRKQFEQAMSGAQPLTEPSEKA